MTYDRNRLMASVTNGQTSTYTCDPYGRLRTIQAGGKTLEKYTYDGRRYTPDLAFRILLMALSCKGRPISWSQYERFKRIGEALHCGEFVVSDVEFLVPQ